MRTTLTLDEDVAAKFEGEVRRRKHSFKQVVNDLLRYALNAKPDQPRSPFTVRPHTSG